MYLLFALLFKILEGKVNSKNYQNLPNILHNNNSTFRYGMEGNETIIFQHDNAPSHTVKFWHIYYFFLANFGQKVHGDGLMK